MQKTSTLNKQMILDSIFNYFMDNRNPIMTAKEIANLINHEKTNSVAPKSIGNLLGNSSWFTHKGKNGEIGNRGRKWCLATNETVEIIKYECPICGLRARNLMGLQKHYRKYLNGNCPICGEYYSKIRQHFFQMAVNNDCDEYKVAYFLSATGARKKSKYDKHFKEVAVERTEVKVRVPAIKEELEKEAVVC